MGIDYHFVHDHVTQGSFIVSHISSKDQLADALTRPLPFIMFKHLIFKIGIFNGSTVLRGHDKAYPSPLPILTNSPTSLTTLGFPSPLASSTKQPQQSQHLPDSFKGCYNNLLHFQIFVPILSPCK